MLWSIYVVSFVEVAMLSLDALGAEDTSENVSFGQNFFAWSLALEVSVSDPNLVKLLAHLCSAACILFRLPRL